MTLSTTTNTATYTGNESTTAFSFPYLFFADGDLTVTVDGTVRTLNGAGTYDFTVSGAGNVNGGTVTINNAPTSGMSVVMQRIVDYTQETDFENFDGNPADVTEKQFDLVVMQAQQLSEQTDRTILSPIGTSLTSNTISGTIDSTTRVLTISSAGPATATITSFGDLNVIETSSANGDLLQYDGTNWVNVSEIDTAQLADDAVTAAKIDINSATDTTITASDLILFGDVSDGNKIKRDPVQGILDLVPDSPPVLDEDDFASDSATSPPSQQSAKVYIANQIAANPAALSESFTSAEQTITTGGSLSIAHGLSSTPYLYSIFLVCKSAEHGYSVNDQVAFNVAGDSASGSNILSLVTGSTNIAIRLGAATIQIANKSNGNISTITTSSWRLVVRAWA